MASADRRLRVLIVVENLPSPFDRRVWQEATTLKHAGYQVSILCPTGKGCEEKHALIDDIHIYRYNLPFEARGALGYALEYSIALFWQFILAWWVYLIRGFDIIHACNPPDDIFLIALCFRPLGVRFIFDHHDLNPELYEAKFGRRDLFHRLLLALERWTFRTADVSIATNESYRKIAIQRGGMNPHRVFVVRSGPSLERMKIMPPIAELKRGRRYLVGYVGVMGPQDGVHFLLGAARHIVHELRREDIHFGLVGDGPEMPQLVELRREYELNDYVTFTGRVPDAEMLAMLNTADVCVNPDVYNEMNDKSTMNKVMEYMALGKPIVQYDLTEGRVSAQGASLYARPNDEIDLAEKIVELLENPERRNSMGRIGRERIEEELSWEHEIPKLLAAYEAVLKKPS
jgi:glycosyltransferase involved in cell wall biosynthesis